MCWGNWILSLWKKKNYKMVCFFWKKKKRKKSSKVLCDTTAVWHLTLAFSARASKRMASRNGASLCGNPPLVTPTYILEWTMNVWFLQCGCLPSTSLERPLPTHWWHFHLIKEKKKPLLSVSISLPLGFVTNSRGGAQAVFALFHAALITD